MDTLYKRCLKCNQAFGDFKKKKRRPNKYGESMIVLLCPECGEALGGDLYENGEVVEVQRWGIKDLTPEQYRTSPIARRDLTRLAKCPYCNFDVGIDNPIAYCARCGCEYDVLEKERIVLFDQKKRTSKYAWPKAFAKAGGVKIGNTGDCEEK